MSERTLFHSLSYDDVDAAIVFLTAVGFTDAGVHRDEHGTVVHAQFNWRETGAIMFGQTRPRGDDHDWVEASGHGMCYCVVESDADVDRVHEAALRAGARSVQEPADMDYGGRGATVRDAEGNQWSFGSYRGQ